MRNQLSWDYNMRAQTINFERDIDPKEAMNIGSNRILYGEDLIAAIVDHLWPDVFFENYSREAGNPSKDDVEEYARNIIEDLQDSEIKNYQPATFNVAEFGSSWDMY